VKEVFETDCTHSSTGSEDRAARTMSANWLIVCPSNEH
jgi:hypothetical protein